MIDSRYRTVMVAITVSLFGTGIGTGTDLSENVFLHCLPESMKLRFVTSYPFNGRIYVYDSVAVSCETYGSGSTLTEIVLPLNSDCVVTDTTSEVFTSIVTVQHHRLVQKKGDRRLRLTCNYRIVNQTVSSAFNAIVDHVHDGSVVDATAPSPRVRFRVLDKRGVDVMDTKLGQELFLRVDMDENSIFALAPRSLIASSGSTSEHIQLLDSRGCPLDNVIFSGLDANQGDSRFLQGRFQAFKFADDVIVRFHLNVQFCVHQCPPVRCNPIAIDKSVSRRRKRRHNLNLSAGYPFANPPQDPVLPLEKEIIVDGATVTSLPNPASSSSSSVTSVGNTADDFLCLSKNWFVGIVVCLVLLQICIGLTCAICIQFRRQSLYDHDPADTDDPDGSDKRQPANGPRAIDGPGPHEDGLATRL